MFLVLEPLTFFVSLKRKRIFKTTLKINIEMKESKKPTDIANQISLTPASEIRKYFNMLQQLHYQSNMNLSKRLLQRCSEIHRSTIISRLISSLSSEVTLNDQYTQY